MSQAGLLNTSSSSTPVNPLQTISDFDDFLSAPGFDSSHGDPKLGWQNFSKTWHQFPGTATNPGIVYNFGGTPDSDSFLLANNNNDFAGTSSAFLLGGGSLSINWLIDLGTLSNGVNRYITYIGLSDTNVQDVIAQPQNGCFFGKLADHMWKSRGIYYCQYLNSWCRRFYKFWNNC